MIRAKGVSSLENIRSGDKLAYFETVKVLKAVRSERASFQVIAENPAEKCVPCSSPQSNSDADSVESCSKRHT